MKAHNRSLIFCLSILLAQTILFAEVNMEEWAYIAPIKMTPAPDKGLVQVDLGSEILDVARPDLADLRVVSETGQEVGYVLVFGEDNEQVKSVPVVLYDRTSVDGQSASVVLAFGQKVLKNRVEIITPGVSFRRRVLIESSQDSKKWQKVREDAFIFRISREAGVTHDKNVVAFPDNQDPYLRVTVFNDAFDRGRIDIDDVLAWQVLKTSAKTVSVPILETSVRDVPQEKSTEVTVDLGVRNLSLHMLTLQFEDRNFFRRVSISGRDQKERVIRTSSENAPIQEQTVQEPWDVVTTGAVYRYSGRHGSDDSLTVSLKGCRYRYLNIRIENDDEPSLHFSKAEVSRLAAVLEFQAKAGHEFRLLAGNMFASVPNYELARDADRLRAQNIHPAALGEVSPNPGYRQPGAKPASWFEEHRLVSWVILIVVVVLGIVFVRRWKRVSSISGKEH